MRNDDRHPSPQDEIEARRVALLGHLHEELGDILREIQDAAERIRVGAILSRDRTLESSANPDRIEAATAFLMDIHPAALQARDLLRGFLLGAPE